MSRLSTRAWRGLAAAMSFALLAACASLAARPVPPTVQVAGVAVAVTSAGETRLRVLLDVHNPNEYAITVQRIEAVIRIEDQDVAMAELPTPAMLPATGDAHVEIEARPDLDALRRAVERVARRLGGRYEVNGYAIVQGGIRLDFNRQGELPLASLLGKLR